MPMNIKIDPLPGANRMVRTKRIWAAGFVAVFSTFSCVVVLVHEPSWPVAAAVAAEAAVVTVFCYVMLRHD